MRYSIVPLLVASLTFAVAQADNGRQGQGADKSNHGQVVSECNHRANDEQYHPKVRKAVENSQTK